RTVPAADQAAARLDTLLSQYASADDPIRSLSAETAAPAVRLAAAEAAVGEPVAEAPLLDGEISAPGEQDAYEFELSQDGPVLIDSLATPELHWQLSQGEHTLASGPLSGEDRLLALRAGRYRLT
ncbi:hypothetical protein, partial [Parachitinimonas caeni]